MRIKAISLALLVIAFALGLTWILDLAPWSVINDDKLYRTVAVLAIVMLGWVTFLVNNKRQPVMCECGDRPASACDETWGPECDLGNNPKYARVYRMSKDEEEALERALKG